MSHGVLVRFTRDFQPLQVLAVQRLGGTEIHRNAVLHHPVPLENLVEDLQRAAAIHHEVFGDDLEPIDDRLLAEDVLVVGNAQADAYTIVRVSVETIRGHGGLPLSVR